MVEYTTVELARLLGVNRMAIINLVTAGIIKPLQDVKGRGSRRKYSEQNRKQFLVAQVLKQAKVPLREIGEILTAWDNIDDLISKSEEFYTLYCQLKKEA